MCQPQWFKKMDGLGAGGPVDFGQSVAEGLEGDDVDSVSAEAKPSGRPFHAESAVAVVDDQGAIAWQWLLVVNAAYRGFKAA